MCQLNLYCVSKTVDPQKVITILNNCFNCSVAEHLGKNDYYVEGLEADYNFFACAGMRCNCGSMISRYQDATEQVSWQELRTNEINKEVERLTRVALVMEQPNYKQLLNNYKKTQAKLWAEYQRTEADLRKAEKELFDSVRNRTDLTEQEKEDLMIKEIYPKLQTLHTELNEVPEHKKAVEAYRKFMQENDALIASSLYTLKPHKPGKRKHIYYDESGQEHVEYYPTTSSNIYDVIQEKKETFFKFEETEFSEIKASIESILKLTNEVKIYSFWQDGDPLVVNERYEISLDDFNETCAVYLKYKDLLTIKKF